MLSGPMLFTVFGPCSSACWCPFKCNVLMCSFDMIYSQCQNYRTEPGGQKYGKIPYLCPPPGSNPERSRKNLIIERGGGQRYGILPYFCPPGSVL